MPGKTPSDEERQRFATMEPILKWIRAHAGETFTLTEVAEGSGRPRPSTSSGINRIISGNVLPGLTRVAKGVYRYDPPTTTIQVSAPRSTTVPVAAVELKPELMTKRRFTEVGMVGRSAVVIVDADGNLWRAERLK